MNKKRAADTTIFLVFIAITLIAGFYREQLQGSSLFIWGAGAGAVIFLIQALRDKESFPRSLSEATEKFLHGFTGYYRGGAAQ